MKKIYLNCMFIFLGLNLHAQDLIFDPTFNNGMSNNDFDLTPDPDLSDYNLGGVKKLNDSVFLYFRNMVNWNNQDVISEVYAKKISAGGYVSTDYMYTSQNYFGQGDPELFTISDLVIASSRVYILQNQAYDDNGTTKNGIYVGAYDYSNGAFNPSTWASGGGSIQVAENIMNAKGVGLSSGLITLAFRSSNGGPWQVASTSVGSVSGNISFGGITTLTNNPTGTFSNVVDMVFVSSNEIYIADMASSCVGGSCNDLARVLKYNPTTFSLVSDYTAGGTGISQTMNWNTQTNTPIVQDYISKLLYQNGKIIVVGTTNNYDGSPYAISRGRITRLNPNGSIDNTFAINSSITGTFTNSPGSGYFRWEFHDIDMFSTGELFVSAHGTFGNGPSDPIQCFFLKLDADGELNTAIGNNGTLFESPDFTRIEETIVLPGTSTLTDKFVFNGLRQLNPGSTTTMGRLVWSNSGAANLSELNQNSLSIYPNPTSTSVHIELGNQEKITILTSQGKQIATLSGASNYTFDASNLEAGIYFIQSESGATQKFMKH